MPVIWIFHDLALCICLANGASPCPRGHQRPWPPLTGVRGGLAPMPPWPWRGLHDAILCRVAVGSFGSLRWRFTLSARASAVLAAADGGEGGDWRRCCHGHGAGCVVPSSAAWRLARSAACGIRQHRVSPSTGYQPPGKGRGGGNRVFIKVLRGILGKWKLTDRVLVNWLSPNTPPPSPCCRRASY